MNIVGIVVSFLPNYQDTVTRRIERQGGEIHAIDPKGKMVVTVEHSEHRVIADLLTDLQNSRGVLNAAMVYHEIDVAESSDARIDHTLLESEPQELRR